jgi:SNF2 family DNA or RNA helicase
MPLTLHAAWLRSEGPFADGNLFFWAETLEFSALSRTEPAPVGGALLSRTRGPKTPSHPGQVSVHQLRHLLSEELPSLPLTSLQPTSASIWLPTRNGQPLARRSVVHTSTDGRTGVATSSRPELVNWQVTGLILEPPEALTFLSQLRSSSRRRGMAERDGMQRLRLGNDLLYWSNAAKFALEILVGQSYLPTLRNEDVSHLYALWQPVLLDDRVRHRFRTLCAEMPAVCRAYNLESTNAALGAQKLTEHFVATLVDSAVRKANAGAVPPGAQPAIQWLHRLSTTDRQIALPPQPAHRFTEEWQNWIEQLHVTSDTNFRITFDLLEPQESGASAGMTGALGDGYPGEGERTGWSLNYFLQARDDHRLLIPAEQVWQVSNSPLRIGNRRVDRPQERLLAGLGAASRLFAPIERSLRQPRPESAPLSAAEAHRFLVEIGPLLESNGFGVMLPDWWNAKQRTRLGLRLRLFSEQGDIWRENDETPGRLPAARTPADGKVRYEWELTLGAERITQAEFDNLVAMNTPLLKLRDRWVELDGEQVQAAKRFLSDRQASGEMSLLQSIRMAQAYYRQQNAAAPLHSEQPGESTVDEAVAAAIETDVLPLEAVDVEGWLESVLDHLRSQKPVHEMAEPEGFIGELRPYQRRGVGWLVYLRRLGLGACLADDMGLGKTVQAIAMLLHERKRILAETGRRPDPILLVCPTSVVTNWRREVERFAPMLKVLLHHGSTRLEGAAFLQSLDIHDMVITSFGTARRDIEVLGQVLWSDLILDEAQNIKNPGAKQSQAVRKIKAANRVALTGTPVENHLTELWSVLEFLNPGYLGGHERFRQQYMVPIERYNDEERAVELRRLVQPFLLRRLKSDPTIISDLPEKNEMVVYCAMTGEQAALYESTVQDSLALLDRTDGIQRRGLVLSLLTKLKQICNHPAHFLKQPKPLTGRSGKLERLTEMLEEALSVGDHALVFTQFVEMGHLLQNHLSEKLNTDVLFLHGGTPAMQRDQMVQAFQADDGPAIFVLSLRAGGSGLNLTRANHVFHYDRWWNPAVENQATDRAFRIGQLRNVQVHKFVVAGTLEDRIHEIIENKQALAESIVGSGENWLTELDTDQLRELLTLRQDLLDE